MYIRAVPIRVDAGGGGGGGGGLLFPEDIFWFCCCLLLLMSIILFDSVNPNVHPPITFHFNYQLFSEVKTRRCLPSIVYRSCLNI